MRRIFGVFAMLVAASAVVAQPHVILKLIATGLDQPLALTHAGDERIFVTQQPGRILILGRTTPFLDIHARVSCCQERGLLSVAFHPHYRDNRFFFVDYTNLNGDTVIARYSVSASDPDRGDSSSEAVLL